MAKKTKRENKPFCKNCALYTPDETTPGWGTCGLAILHEGKQVHVPVEYEDKCHFEKEYIFRSKHGGKEVWKPDVKNVKWWEENGGVKIEYPEGFFGSGDDKQ